MSDRGGSKTVVISWSYSLKDDFTGKYFKLSVPSTPYKGCELKTWPEFSPRLHASLTGCLKYETDRNTYQHSVHYMTLSEKPHPQVAFLLQMGSSNCWRWTTFQLRKLEFKVFPSQDWILHPVFQLYPANLWQFLAIASRTRSHTGLCCSAASGWASAARAPA